MIKIKTPLLLVILSNFMALSSYALTYELNTNDKLAEKIFIEASDLVPYKITNHIKTKISIEVKNLNKKTLFAIPKDCDATVKLTQSSKNKIIIDPVVMMAIRENKPLNCKYKNPKKFAISKIINEIASIYDRHNKHSNKNSFLSISGWFKKGILKTFKNNNINKDIFLNEDEFKTPADTFAINLEHFILDENFRCARPNYYHYFVDEFEYIPYTDGELCIPSATIISNDHPIVIDRSRIYQIHYLFASEGTASMSKWGHAMFRIVMCSPDRNSVGPECMTDTLDHVVLSYAAEIPNHMINPLQGLNGSYNALMSVTSMSDVVKKYTEIEGRNLISYPLEMDTDEINRFLDKTIEAYWGYIGKYYFITNNCAVESLNHLKSVFIDNKKLYNSKILTPLSLRKHLIDLNIINTSSLIDLDEAKRTGHFIESNISRINKTLQDLVIDEDYHSILKNYSAQSRFELLNEAFELQKDSKMSYASLIRIESSVVNYLNISIDNNFTKFLVKIKNKKYEGVDKNLIKKAERLMEIQTIFDVKSKITTSSFGAPTETQLQKSLDEIYEHRTNNLAMLNEFVRLKEEINSKVNSKLLAEIDVSNKNTAFYMQKMKEALKLKTQKSLF